MRLVARILRLGKCQSGAPIPKGARGGSLVTQSKQAPRKHGAVKTVGVGGSPRWRWAAWYADYRHCLDRVEDRVGTALTFEIVIDPERSPSRAARGRVLVSAGRWRTGVTPRGTPSGPHAGILTSRTCPGPSPRLEISNLMLTDTALRKRDAVSWLSIPSTRSVRTENVPGRCISPARIRTKVRLSPTIQSLPLGLRLRPTTRVLSCPSFIAVHGSWMPFVQCRSSMSWCILSA